MLFFSRKQGQLLVRFRKIPAFSCTQRSNYVDVKMKWKKDSSFDSLDILTKGKDLRPLVSLKNIIARESEGCIPISAVSKRGRELEISGRVASFLRRYPAVFQEFTGPKYNLPWFKLTEEAAELDREERDVYETRRMEIVDRLRRLILMSRERRLPLRIVQGMLWYLGLPEDFLRKPEEISKGCFQIAELEDEEQGLTTIIDRDEPVLSALQRNQMKKLNGTVDSLPSAIPFPLFPSKGLRLKQKIEHWLEEFQKLPYVSPYEDFSHLDPSSDISEKRVAGVLHELLSLFVDNSAERRRLLCLRKQLGLPQKFHEAFERHPHVFYLLLKNKTCFVVLKEAYYARSATTIVKHPMLEVRKKYVRLMNKSEAILRSRRSRKPLADDAEESLDAAVDSESKEDYDGLDEGMEESLQS
ncbi:protein WHAT'S THIS FACTOR 9, mitochondrial [Phoenix dactylifera]|uniref:Protein WHAT'S THIS FACTOR 9, mitochondrial n=1 Tax=Phoenix dactylifera TaxID=42345 RepID=A0A8B7BJ10_PHODC|nr:protein WHAT'S THIS FACTOR 9, mitochondrial [Phoenix dactylifera]